nr:DUF6338 family protein [Mycobacterium sp. UM_CSW]
MVFCFVTAGFVFQMLRERRHPPRSYSTLMETSIIVVSSVAFSMPAMLGLFALQGHHFPGFPDLEQLAEQPAKYAAAHLAAIVLMIVLSVAAAVGLAFAWDWVLQKKRPAPLVTRDSVWFEVLVGRARHKNSKAAIITVELKDGGAVMGAVKAHGLNDDSELDWIVLDSHSQCPLQSRSKAGDFRILGREWPYYVISGGEIRAATVGYADTAQ